MTYYEQNKKHIQTTPAKPAIGTGNHLLLQRGFRPR